MTVDRRSLLQVGLGSGALLGAGAAEAATKTAAPVKAAAPKTPAKPVQTLAPTPATTAPHYETTGPVRDGYAAALDEINHYAWAHMNTFGLPGMTVSIVDADGFTAFMRLGYADRDRRTPVGPDHLFQIGSISKSVAALCIFKAIEAGKLALTDDVRPLLPGVPWPEGVPVTVQQLLNHSSGLADDPPVFPNGGDGKLWRGYEPGTHWSYSNTGYELLGMLVDRIEGRSFASVAQAQVLGPLGMSKSHASIREGDRAQYAMGYSPLYPDRPYPRAGKLAPASWVHVTGAAGCVSATAADMARYARFLIAMGQGKGAPVLSDAMATRFVKPTIDAPGWGSFTAPQYANGLAVVQIGGRPLLHHTGGMIAFSSSIHADPKAGVAAFASTNIGMTGYRPRDLTAFICERLRAVREGTPAPTPKALTPPKLANAVDFARTYTARDGRTVRVTQETSGLAIEIGGIRSALEAQGPDHFILKEAQISPFGLAFVRRAGLPASLWWGEIEYAADGRFANPPSAAIAALAGRYDSDDPWTGTLRFTAREDGLYLDGVQKIVQAADGSWRAADDAFSPERIRFDQIIDGKPSRALASGTAFLRRGN